MDNLVILFIKIFRHTCVVPLRLPRNRYVLLFCWRSEYFCPWPPCFLLAVLNPLFLQRTPPPSEGPLLSTSWEPPSLNIQSRYPSWYSDWYILPQSGHLIWLTHGQIKFNVSKKMFLKKNWKIFLKTQLCPTKTKQKRTSTKQKNPHVFISYGTYFFCILPVVSPTIHLVAQVSNLGV